MLMPETRRTVRYRCHTGHAYSADSLLGAVTANIEDSLWTAIRGVEESILLLYQLFYNLIMNSLKFSKKGVPVEIVINSEIITGENNNIAQITLTDNGIGFEPGFEERIFDPFTRLHRSDQFEGTGLGLALCKKIVERHRGTISASSLPEGGAKFTILFPI